MFCEIPFELIFGFSRIHVFPSVLHDDQCGSSDVVTKLLPKVEMTRSVAASLNESCDGFEAGVHVCHVMISDLLC